jgi:hypothetical protein
MSNPIVLTDPALIETLTPMERALVQHPLAIVDPRAAARDAGYAEHTLKRAAAKVKSLRYFVDHYNKQRMEAREITAETISRELSEIAFADATAYYETMDTEEGETVKMMRDVLRLPEGMRRAIKSISYSPTFDKDGKPTGGDFTVELYDKMSALRTLAEFYGLAKGALAPRGAADPMEAHLLEYLEPEELETLNAIYSKVAERAKNISNKKRDARAIPAQR